MTPNPVAAKRQRRRPKPGLRSSLRRQLRSARTCHPKTCNQSFSGRQKRAQQDDCCNQQYSIVALTNSAAGIAERYVYSAYGEPVFATGAGVVLTESAKDNRYTYTGREWDEGLGLYHFRARMYDAASGRFFGRDPKGYVDGYHSYCFVRGNATGWVDPMGLLQEPVEPEVPYPHPGVEPGPTQPCSEVQYGNATETIVEICEREVREPRSPGGIFGHIYLKILCGNTALEEWTFSATGTNKISDECKGKCTKQLRGYIGQFTPIHYPVKDQPPVGSPEFPENGERHNCRRYRIGKSPKALTKCLFDLSFAVRKCCIQYDPTAIGDPQNGCNSNCFAYWLASTCFQPVLEGGQVEPPDGIPLTPGWGKPVPDCVSKAISAN